MTDDTSFRPRDILAGCATDIIACLPQYDLMQLDDLRFIEADYQRRPDILIAIAAEVGRRSAT